MVVPDDFLALDQPPVATTDDGTQHVVPGFTTLWRARILATWRTADPDPVVDRGVYWQVNGPRFETPAEVRFLAAFADLVGMTVASECVAANQLGLDYAAVCVIDNLANGIGAAPLTPAEYREGAAANTARLHPGPRHARPSARRVTLTVTGARLPTGEPIGLRAVDGRIDTIGTDVHAEPGDEVLDGTDRLLVPPLVNGHTHAAMTLFRGFAGDRSLLDWLEGHIWPAEARLDADDVYWGTRLACLEMIRTGTTRFWDMYWQPAAVAHAVTDAGLRADGRPPAHRRPRPGAQPAAPRRRAPVPRRAGRRRPADHAVLRPARHLHGQRRIPRVDRR